MSSFNLGDKVIYTSGRFSPSPTNPLHTTYPEVTGEVIRTDALGALHIRVQWSNGFKNCYAPKDLEVVSDYSNYKNKLNI